MDSYAASPVYAYTRTNGPLKLAMVVLINCICISIHLFNTSEVYDEANGLFTLAEVVSKDCKLLPNRINNKLSRHLPKRMSLFITPTLND